MFEDSLLEKRFSKTHRRGATFVSFALQIVIVGGLVALPLFFVEALPARETVTLLVAPPPPPPPPPPPAAAPKVQLIRHKVESEVLDNGALREPTHIPKKIAMIKENTPPPSLRGVVGGVPGGVPGGVLGGVIGGIVGSTPAPRMPKMAVQPERVRVSQGVTEGLLIHKVTPQYPAIAREAGVHGSVLLHAVISKDGTIERLKLISGSPFLVPAAIDAVKQWRFKPYLLNGKPVEVDTVITLKFNLA